MGNDSERMMMQMMANMMAGKRDEVSMPAPSRLSSAQNLLFFGAKQFCQ